MKVEMRKNEMSISYEQDTETIVLDEWNDTSKLYVMVCILEDEKEFKQLGMKRADLQTIKELIEKMISRHWSYATVSGDYAIDGFEWWHYA